MHLSQPWWISWTGWSCQCSMSMDMNIVIPRSVSVFLFPGSLSFTIFTRHVPVESGLGYLNTDKRHMGRNSNWKIISRPSLRCRCKRRRGKGGENRERPQKWLKKVLIEGVPSLSYSPLHRSPLSFPVSPFYACYAAILDLNILTDNWWTANVEHKTNKWAYILGRVFTSNPFLDQAN